MKKYLTLLLFAFITTITFGQNNYQDVVYLKNGSIIRGVIIEEVPNKSIKIETADKSVFIYQMDEIEKFAREPYQGKTESYGNKSGYKGIVELGYQFGTSDYGNDRMKLNIINGYQINPYFSLGLGTGFRYYFGASDLLIPIFADFRVNFINKNVSPYLSFGAGYSFNGTSDFYGVGFLFNPTVGVSIKVSERNTINIGLGLEIQRSNYYEYNNPYFIEYTESLEAVSFDCGISF